MASSGPTLNPIVASAASAVGGWFKSIGSAAAASMEPGAVPWLFVVFLFVLGFSVLVYYLTTLNKMETPTNIRRIGMAATQAQKAYAISNPTRMGLREYLRQQTANGLPAEQQMLCNFYVSTVTTAGLYFPARGGVISAEAVRTAVLAGARGFVFDVYPDLIPAANYAPIVQVVEAGSNWRRISLNQASFASLLRPLVEEAFEIPTRPGHEDPILLYIRFRGKPRAATFQGVADAIRGISGAYRLDASYGNCRRANTLGQTPLSQLFKKLIVFSNKTSTGTGFDEVVNAGPADGRPLEVAVSDLKGQSDASRAALVKTTKQNVVWVAPTAEGGEAEKNNVAFKEAQASGIQCVALNFWNNEDTLRAAKAATMFGKSSFVMKPISLRTVPEFRAPPGQPAASLNVGDGRPRVGL